MSDNSHFRRVVKFMKKIFLLLLTLIALPAFAENAQQPSQAQSKEIATLNQYFEYLPNAVHNNWTPYKANEDYEVTVQFRVKKNGEITEPFIVKSTNKNANSAVLNAVKSGAPYLPLPKSFSSESVNTQVMLKYMK